MKLQKKLDAFKKDFEAQVPGKILAVIHRATRDLENSGIPAKAVAVGSRFPVFTLKDTVGGDVVLADLMARGPVVVGFYRGRW